MNPSGTSMQGGASDSGVGATGASAVPFQFGPAQPRFAPSWAERFGEDREGIFAKFGLDGVPFEWRWIPPGRFWMGAAANEKPNFEKERPRHEVILTHGFWMGRTPVTQEQWLALMKELPSRRHGDALPVEKVSWEDAMAFAMRLNVERPGLAATLPTEAQWEYACRAGTHGAFGDGSPCTEPEGSDPALDRLGWFHANSNYQTHPVGLKDCNPWGLHDMHGNVWEWCLDGARRYGDALEVNPVGFLGGFLAVIRGGSWLRRAGHCRCAGRNSRERGTREFDLGFRLVAGEMPWGAERP
jgi:formylglycine-generating enzyme required for sulfatase activity